MLDRNIPEPALEPNEDDPVCLCGKCQQEVYRGEALFTWKGRKVCPDCFRAALVEWMEGSLSTLADALMVEMEEVG